MNITFQEAVALAKRSGACDAALDVVSRMSGWDEFARHPQAPKWACWYAISVAGARVPELEPIIARDPQEAYYYALDLAERFPEGEPVIAKNSNLAYFYAYLVIKDRWPEAEPVIAKSTTYAYVLIPSRSGLLSNSSPPQAPRIQPLATAVAKIQAHAPS